ncbi:transducin beta-like protein 2 isoform X2 [Chrysoperla carnea]|uniref:transducin beta-like protein 2 isoform X2 n=1 Tax=Chrysoperla carnea TaxID=189513 RepID=UPI001D08F41D|nr:transducin beta-like protein 2 isoform X2 [Chrysoperla carnea]
MSFFSLVDNPLVNIWITIIFCTTILLLFVVKRLLIKANNNSKQKSKTTSKVKNQTQTQGQRKEAKVKDTTTKTKKKLTDNQRFRADKQAFSHSWLLTSFKGHTGEILDIDFSSNGKYLASCSEDRTVLVWYMDDLNSVKKDHKSFRINIEYDHGIFIKWSPDTKAFIIQKAIENCIEVYKVEKKKDSGALSTAKKVLTFPKTTDDDLCGFGIANSGRFIMTCTITNNMTIWDLRGNILAQLETYLMTTHRAKVSPCGKFVAACGFAPDCKIWEVVFNKSGEFQQIKRAFELSGHTSGIFDVAFTADSSHIATVSKDGTWKVYNINVEYNKGEDPHLIITGHYENQGGSTRLALSPNAEVLVIATYNTLLFFDVTTGELDNEINDIFADNITQLLFDPTGKYVLVSGDKHIRTFHNITGYRTEIRTAENKLKQHQTSATKERLENLIEQNKVVLDKHGETYDD